MVTLGALGEALGERMSVPFSVWGQPEWKVPTLRSPSVVAQHCHPTLATLALSVQRPWVLGRGMSPQGAPGAGGDLGVFLAAAATALQLSP